MTDQPRKFKERRLDNIYWLCRKSAADRTSEFYLRDGVTPHRGAGHRNAYWTGREGKPNRLWSRGTFTYACWAAGRDDYRAANKKTAA